MGVFGDTLRQARAHKGVTLREAEQATRISRHYLLALEEEHFDQLPALIYQRGIVKNYASYLGLDQSKLLRLYQDATGEPEPAVSVVVGPGQAIEPAGGFVPNFAVIGFIVVVMAVMFAWGYSAYVASPNDVTLTQAPPTATTLSQDDRFIPSRTPAQLTPTPADDADEEATGNLAPRSDDDAEQEPQGEIVIPSPTATAEPMEITLGDDDSDATSEDEPADLSLDEGDAETATGDQRFAFYTEDDITITVVVDNVVQWEGPLAAGTETSFLSGSDFLVTFSGADSIVVIDAQGNQRQITGPTANLP